MSGHALEATMRALVAGTHLMCRAPGCAHVFPVDPTASGNTGKRYCGQPDCTRRRRVTAKHRNHVIRDVKVEMRLLDDRPLPRQLDEAVRELVRALTDGGDQEDVRIMATKLAAVSAELAAKVEALGTSSLTARPSPQKALNGGGRQEVARAALEAAS